MFLLAKSSKCLIKETGIVVDAVDVVDGMFVVKTVVVFGKVVVVMLVSSIEIKK
jgi:hypothetical protein